jgi:hypothetical protein
MQPVELHTDLGTYTITEAGAFIPTRAGIVTLTRLEGNNIMGWRMDGPSGKHEIWDHTESAGATARLLRHLEGFVNYNNRNA